MLNPLDHNSFPHIADLVVTYADLSVKIAFRATAREFRDKVDRLIFQHVAISPVMMPTTSRVSQHPNSENPSPETSVPHEQAVEMREPEFPLFRRLPFLPWYSNWAEDDLIPRAEITLERSLGARENLGARLASRYRQLDHVRVVDYYPFRDHPAVDQLPQLLLNVEVLRRRLPLPTWIKAATVVDYLNITSSICHRTGHVPYAFVRAPEDCKRYVLHISYDPSHPYLGMAAPSISFGAPPSPTPQVVIVLTAQSVAPVEGCPVRPVNDGTIQPLGFIATFLPGINSVLHRLKDKATIELVGVERFPPGYLGLDSSLQGAALIEEVRTRMFAQIREYDWCPRELQLAERITFTTLEEWRVRTPALEAVPALALPDINEDAQDAEWWSMDAALGDFGPTPALTDSPHGSPPLHGF